MNARAPSFSPRIHQIFYLMHTTCGGTREKMAEKKEKRSVLPWGMSIDGLQPNSVKVISLTSNPYTDDRVYNTSHRQSLKPN